MSRPRPVVPCLLQALGMRRFPHVKPRGKERPMAMNMNQMMQQARKMQEQMAKVEEELKTTTVDASAGGGMVKVTVNGSMMLESITIDPEALDPEDVEMLQDMIVAAVTEAQRGVGEIASRQMSAVTGGLNLPGMPF